MVGINGKLNLIRKKSEDTLVLVRSYKLNYTQLHNMSSSFSLEWIFQGQENSADSRYCLKATSVNKIMAGD